MRRGTILVLAGLLAGAALLAACGSDTKPGTLVRLSVNDAVLRKPGEPCSGGGGYLYIHEGGPYSVVDPASGDVLAGGKLPTGTAVRLGAPIEGAAVEPTLCGLAFHVELPDQPRYALRLEQGKPLPFARADVVALKVP